MHSLDPTYPLFPICSFLAFILPLIPLPWHLKAWNSGLCYYIFWTSLASLNLFINSVVWASDAINRAPIFCDISIRISAGASIGIPAASLCIVKRLYTISTVQSAQTTRAEKRRVVLIDSLICILFPLIIVALQTIVLGHRFDILEGAGCIPAVYNTHLTYFIFSMWPAVIGFISAIYFLTLLAFRRRQMEFNQYLRNSTSLTISRYFRLMALVTTETLFTVPLTLFTIILSVKQAPPNPWISWEETHYDFWRVEQYPAILWRSNFFVVVGTELSRWVVPLCAFIFFAFFGFAEEARKNYNEAFLAASKFTKLDRVFTKLRPV
ncbi:fungal pheromone STE3G-protein-coupled receptor [Pterulicium gracile]|uniref:Fungal pheromone STE3G-protein-coupled receptor n=1 Tax=Pterulicium gracile TaxID=1884261 RepID=A0A5C3Q393_9AGAR|nr:fungal pheromone STE3G-protein-coupled receptor [Pterula gracilis]